MFSFYLYCEYILLVFLKFLLIISINNLIKKNSFYNMRIFDNFTINFFQVKNFVILLFIVIWFFYLNYIYLFWFIFLFFFYRYFLKGYRFVIVKDYISNIKVSRRDISEKKFSFNSLQFKQLFYKIFIAFNVYIKKIRNRNFGNIFIIFLMIPIIYVYLCCIVHYLYDLYVFIISYRFYSLFYLISGIFNIIRSYIKHLGYNFFFYWSNFFYKKVYFFRLFIINLQLLLEFFLEYCSLKLRVFSVDFYIFLYFIFFYSIDRLLNILFIDSLYFFKYLYFFGGYFLIILLFMFFWYLIYCCWFFKLFYGFYEKFCLSIYLF